MKKVAKYLSIFIILSLTKKSLGQSINYFWVNGAGVTSNSKVGKNTSTDASGNVIVVGDFNSPVAFGSTTLSTFGYGDIFVVKYSSSGTVQWAKSAGGSSYDYVKGVSAQASGEILITGYFNSPTITFDTFTLTNADNTGTTRDIFIVKYDSLGNVLWAKSAGGSLNDYGYSVSTDNTGNSVVVGSFFSNTITFGSSTLTNFGSAEMFIVKYGPSGNVLWAKSTGGALSDEAYGVSTDATGNVLVTGYFNSLLVTFDSVTLNNSDGSSGTSDMFLVKYDAVGNVLWAKSGSGSPNEYGRCVSADNSGNIFIAGNFNSSTFSIGTTTLNNLGGEDLFIVKYSPSGNVLWAKNEGGLSNEYGYGISTDVSGNVMITGTFNSPNLTVGTTTYTNAGNTDVLAVKYDPLGNVILAQTWGGNSSDEAYGITTDGSGNSIITGYFSSPTINFGSNSLTNGSSGNSDFFAVKLGYIATSVFEKDNERIASVYPNPFQNIFTVQLNNENSGIINLEVVNILGEILYQTSAIDNKYKIDLSNESSGVYFIKIKTINNDVSYSKLIKQ